MSAAKMQAELGAAATSKKKKALTGNFEGLSEQSRELGKQSEEELSKMMKRNNGTGLRVKDLIAECVVVCPPVRPSV